MFNTLMIIKLAVAVLACYLIGSLNPAIIICKLFYKTDIRTIGSGNAGSTNVLRSFGKRAAIPVFLLDIAKGIIGYAIGSLLFSGMIEGALICAFAAIMGHIFPVYYGFRGGKGVATTLGVCLVAATFPTMITLLLVVAIFAIGKRISLGSLLGILLVTVITAIFAYDTSIVIFEAVMTVIIWIKHKDNIKRLLKGEEPRFSLKK